MEFVSRVQLRAYYPSASRSPTTPMIVRVVGLRGLWRSTGNRPYTTAHFVNLAVSGLIGPPCITSQTSRLWMVDNEDDAHMSLDGRTRRPRLTSASVLLPAG